MTIKQDSLKKNFSFQVLYHVIVLVLPLITSPLLSRRLGGSALGTYVYVGSIAYYFVAFANLGIMKHGQRLIAARRTDEISLRKTFWSLFFVHAILSVTALLFYVGYIFLFVKSDIEIYWLYLIYVLSALFDITWLFYGLENFKGVVIKNLIIRMIVSGLIIGFVKTPADLPIYTLIEVSSLLVANALLLPPAMKYVRPISFGRKDCLEHVKPMLVLSISVIASTLYTVFDKTLLGILSNKESVAYYEYSNKIVSIPRSFVLVIGSVLFPKACALAANNDYEGRDRYASFAYFGLSIISFASIFGLIAVGPQLVTYYYGDSFSTCGEIVVALSPLILIIGLGEIVRNVFLIPLKKDVFYVVCLCLNAAINLVLSFLLIPVIGIYGAVIGTIGAETFGLIAQIFYCRKNINFRSLGKSLLVFAVIGALMLASIKACSLLFDRTSLKTILFLICVGAFVYVLLSLVAIRFFFKDVWALLWSWIIKKTSLPFPGSGAKDADAPSKDRKRDFAIDLSRIIGIFLILLAHTSLKLFPDSIGFNLRSCDVVIMVFISGLSFAKSWRPILTWKDYFSYVWKRIKRLLIPCWCFITVYFLFVYLMKPLVPNDILSLSTVFFSYSLINGIGYVWIVRVLFCLSVVAPFLKVLVDKIRFQLLDAGIVALGILAISFISIYSRGLTGYVSIVVNDLVLQIIGYGLVFFLAVAYPKFRWMDKIIVFSLSAVSTILLVIFYGFDLQVFKNPPCSTYMTYGLFCSLILYEFLGFVTRGLETLPKVILWLSKNSFTVYFAHVFILFFFDFGGFLPYNWSLQYIILVIGSLVLASLYLLVKKRIANALGTFNKKKSM